MAIKWRHGSGNQRENSILIGVEFAMADKGDHLMQTLTVFQLDDDDLELRLIEHYLSQPNDGIRFDVKSFHNLEQLTLALLDNNAPDIIILDVHLAHNINIANHFETIKPLTSNSIVILKTSDESIATFFSTFAIDDIIIKPIALAQFRQRLLLLAKIRGKFQLDCGIYSNYAAGNFMRQVMDRIPRISNSAIKCIHICGETGTGKELVAEAFRNFHKTKPFIKVNCAAIADNLFESMFFGHVKGAFTGAITNKKGFFEAAHGGWIFLDEISNLSWQAQAALLRTIENNEIIPVGDYRSKMVQVRIVTATNQSLSNLVKLGKFRQDLWQRLSEVIIKLKPLRQRQEEIPELLDFFCTISPGGPYKINPVTKQILCLYDWQQGNIRQLRNCIRAMTENHIDKTLLPFSIPEHIMKMIRNGKLRNGHLDLSKHKMVLTWNTDTLPSLEYFESQVYYNLLKWHVQNGKKLSLRAAARLLGLAYATLRRRINSFVNQGFWSEEQLQRYFKK